ncbi:hypothetical protein MPRM_12150 [Mycobacterium parmense]|uniref:PPE family domain-containing protein n=1 Tax=Mycobacterium parmense TaxID=185642 RepID=A0A7I7YRW1_9MYCO|nr:hypothetical protein MPRM_12150 [Mycobacterium parmense]
MLHAGAGPEPMLAASAAWESLAAELGSAAQSFSAITSGMAGGVWQGPASTAMLATAARYTGMLSSAATQAQSAAGSARVIAGEFEAALAAAVHPALVSANRNELVQLVVSNLFGLNAPAIAATEAQYEQMWAQDVSAMVGYHGGVSAAAAQLSTWSAAIQGLPAQASAVVAGTPAGPVVNALDATVGAGPLGGVISGAEQAVNGYVGQAQQAVINVVNGPSQLLLGRPLIGNAAATTNAGTNATVVNGQSATVPLTMVHTTEPVIGVSVNGGPNVPVLVDTGSTGLVIPLQDIGLQSLSLPTGFGVGGYSGGVNYLYMTMNMPVNFGGGLVTSPTAVDVELFAWPNSLQSLMANGFSFQNYFAPDGVVGVMGVGPNAGGPGPSIVTQALPAPYNQGLLINEAAGTLTFGPAPTTLTPIATLNGAPVTTLELSSGLDSLLGVPEYSVNAVVDSGGVEGTIPISALPGTPISVFAPNGALLYSYNYDTTYFPTPSPYAMNTGALPFLEHPAYLNYGADTLTFYNA